MGALILILLAVSSGAFALDAPADRCANQSADAVHTIRRLKLEANKMIDAQINVLQMHALPTDAANLRTKCVAMKQAYDDLDHANMETARGPSRRVLTAEKDFTGFMNGMIKRDKAAWDASLFAIQQRGYKVEVNYRAVSIKLTKYLVDGMDQEGAPALESVMEFCSPAATGNNLGALSTRFTYSGKSSELCPDESDAKTVSAQPAN